MSLHLGLDLGGTNIKTAVVAGGAGLLSITATDNFPTHAEEGPEGVTRRLIGAGRAAMGSHGQAETIGLGVPGLFDVESGNIALFPNLPGQWPGFPLRDRVSEGLGMPVTMINDARAFTLAESLLGAGRGCGVVVAIVLGTGVGGGVTIDGRIHLGAFGTAGEIGHQIVMPGGPVCGCGNAGCAEALCKADALADLAGKKTAEEVFVAAAGGEERAIEAIRTVAGYLGIALANAITVLGPDKVIIGGGMAVAGDVLLIPIRAAVKQRVTLVPTDKIEVVLGELGSAAGAVGAALAGQDPTLAR